MFGSGKIAINTEKETYLSTEKIRGSVVLELNNPVKAKEVRIIFSGVRGSGRSRRVVHEKKILLDGEKEYDGRRQYEFEFEIPQYKKADFSNFGMFKGFLETLTGDPYQITQWCLDASLNVPMAFDTNCVKHIYIKMNEIGPQQTSSF